jgi:nitrogen fixation NifU-like protein
MTATLAEGKTLPDAMMLTNKDVEHALGGLPEEKQHCSNLAADTLYEAIQDYLYKQSAGGSLSPAQCSGDSWRLLYMKREGGNN